MKAFTRFSARGTRRGPTVFRSRGHNTAERCARGKGCAVIALLCGALVGVATAGVATTQEAAVRLRGNLSPLIAQAQSIGALDKTQQIEFAITLPVRNQAQLGALLKGLYTPGDPLYRHYLKTGEFADRFGPTQADYDAVIAFVKQHGLRVTNTHANRAVLNVAGPAGVIEATFGVHLMRFQAASGRIFHTPDAEPAFPASIAARVAGVVGLDDAVEPRSNIIMPAASGANNNAAALANGIGTGPGNGLAPSDIKTAYNLNGITENGAGQTIALFERDGYLPSDITAYENQFGLPQVTLQNVLLNGVTGTPTAATLQVPYPLGPAEVTLDIELAIALAPGATRIIIYEGTSYTDLYNRIASDNAAQQVSSSWYYGLDSSPSAAIRNSENTAFQQMATQGQSFFAATGDFGDKVQTGTDSNGNPILQFGVQDPSAQPYVTGVGGTTLTTNGAGGAYTSETAWSGSTGGISTIWPIPIYQSAAVSPGSGGSSTFRNLPDVSLNSSPSTGYSIYYYGTWFGTYGGTSCAAPSGQPIPPSSINTALALAWETSGSSTRPSTTWRRRRDTPPTSTTSRAETTSPIRPLRPTTTSPAGGLLTAATCSTTLWSTRPPSG